MSPFYSFCRSILRCIYRTVIPCRVDGADRFPLRGGGILAVNHASFLDPTIAGSQAPREIYYLARRNLFRNPVFAALIRRVNAVPIDRETPSPSEVRTVLRLIRGGEYILMFPEGTRSRDGKLRTGRMGIGMLARRSRATVVPCYIEGAHRVLPRGARFPRPARLRVRYGEPVSLDDLYRLPPTREVYRDVSDRIMAAIGALSKDRSIGKG